MGNAITSYNMRKAFIGLSQAGGENLLVDAYTPDFYILDFHNGGLLGDNTARQKITSEDWDYVVLQEQSYFPLVSVLRDRLTKPALRELSDRIERSGSCGQTILFMPWAWPGGGTFCNTIIDTLDADCTIEYSGFFQMQDSLEAAYLGLAKEMDVAIAPVGTAWKDAYEENRNISLFSQLSNLSNRAGSYLSACVLYATVFQKSPIGNNYRGDLNEADALFFQAIAGKSVLNDLKKWNINTETPTHEASFEVKINRNHVQFHNRSKNAVAYSWEFGDGGSSKEKDPQYTYPGFGEFQVCLQVAGAFGCPRQYCNTLSLEEMVKVYPNPFHRTLTFEFKDNFSGPVTIEVFDVIGKKISEQHLSSPQNTSFKLSNIAAQSGNLVLRISNAENIITQLVVKSR